MNAPAIVLVRHAQASFGADDYDRLSPLGEEQARHLGGWMAQTGLRPAMLAIGPRRRHRRTAELCLDAAGLDLPLLPLEGLDEIDHVELLARLRPDLQGAEALRAELRGFDDPYRAFQRLFEQAVERWMLGAHDADYAATWPQFRSKVLAALERLAQLAQESGGAVWAFTSGGPIGVLASAAAGVPAEHSFRMSWPLVNTGLTRMRPGRRGATLVSYNAWPHLEHPDHRRLLTLR